MKSKHPKIEAIPCLSYTARMGFLWVKYFVWEVRQERLMRHNNIGAAL